MSNIFEKAVVFALKAHEGQLRKDGGVYILHPLEVAAIVGTMTNDLEVLSAAVLHDTVEDTPVTAQDILDNFGEKNCRAGGARNRKQAPRTKSERHMENPQAESLAVLRDSGIESKIIWIGDKLSNVRSFKGL
jgi:myo-inositol-1(or 4)-monophosphatase